MSRPRRRAGVAVRPGHAVLRREHALAIHGAGGAEGRAAPGARLGRLECGPPGWNSAAVRTAGAAVRLDGLTSVLQPAPWRRPASTRSTTSTTTSRPVSGTPGRVSTQQPACPAHGRSARRPEARPPRPDLVRLVNTVQNLSSPRRGPARRRRGHRSTPRPRAAASCSASRGVPLAPRDVWRQRTMSSSTWRRFVRRRQAVRCRWSPRDWAPGRRRGITTFSTSA